MATDIYKQHEAAFSQVAAYVVTQGAERVATIAFKFPRDGAGRLYVYVHWLGAEMVRGHAGGFGYDKKSAACANAARKIRGRRIWDATLNNGFGGYGAQCEAVTEDQKRFVAALSHDDGRYWNDHLGDAGFTVLQAC